MLRRVPNCFRLEAHWTDCAFWRAEASAGRSISVSELQPGDLIFYASGGSIYHVAMYIGGGSIIHAIDEAHGIDYGTLNTGRVYCAVSLF